MPRRPMPWSGAVAPEPFCLQRWGPVPLQTGFVPVEEDGIISFTTDETEEFRLVKAAKTVTVRYRETDFEIERRTWTTEELMELFNVPPGYKLDLIKPDGEFKELKPGDRIKVREGMEFTSHVPIGQSS